MKTDKNENPYGEKWEEEMRKHKKEDLIVKYLKPLLEDKLAQSIIDAREGNLVGFEATASIIRKKLEKFARQKKTSSITVMVKHNSGGEYNGGMMGDVGELIEGLFYMCKSKPEIRTLFEYVVKALQEDDKGVNRKPEMETNVKALYKHKVITRNLFARLDSKGVKDFKELTKLTYEEIKRWFVSSSTKDRDVCIELTKYMGNLGLEFKGEGKKDEENDLRVNEVRKGSSLEIVK